MATSSISWNNLISMNKKKKIRLILHPTKMEIHSSIEDATSLFPLGGEQFLYKVFVLVLL